MKHNWEYKRLGDVCDKASSNLAQKDLEFVDDGYPVFGASGQIGLLDFYHIDRPFIGIVKDGSGVGRTNIYPAKSSLLGTLQYIIPKGGINTDYLCYSIQSLNLSKYANGAAIPHIYYRDYKKEMVPVPPMEVQGRIVAELDKINELIEAKREQLKQLDALAQSLYIHMFGNWPEFEQLSYYVTQLIGGKSLASQETCANKVLKSGAVTYDYFDGSSTKFLPQNYIPIESHKVKVGDVIISRMNTAELVGACAYVFNVEENIFLPDRLWRLEYKPNANPIFLWKSLISETSKRQIRSKASGTSGSMKNISKPLLLSVHIPKVPLALQEQFAATVEAIEAQKATVEKSIAELQTLLDSRMDYWFN